MFDNLEVVKDRIAHYRREPDARFRGASGLDAEDENIAQKIRQYWADDRISNEEKLRGFEMDLSEFDPRNTTFIELRKIAIGLSSLGIIDYTTGSVFMGVALDFDASGNQIEKDKKVDVFACFEKSLSFLSDYISQGHAFASDALIKLNTGITVMLALDDRANASRRHALVDVIV